MSAQVTFNRDQLYELVWSEPISKIGTRFGVSGNAISKICRKLDIPRPPRGYWARLAHGFSVKQPPLPPLKKDGATSHQLNAPQRPAGRSILANRSIPKVAVKLKVTRYHPVVATLRSKTATGREDDFGRIQYATGVNVSRASLPRASRILDALIRELEKRKLTTTLEEKGLTCRVEGERIRIECFEPAKRQTPKKQSAWGYPRWEYVPRGILTLTVWSMYLRDFQTSWTDGKTKKLEDQLGEVVALFEQAPQIITTANEEAHRRHLAIQREQLCQRRKSDVIKFTLERARRVDLLMENLDKCKKVRAFIKAVESGSDVPPATRRLARWAISYANHLDPMVDYSLATLGSSSLRHDRKVPKS